MKGKSAKPSKKRQKKLRDLKPKGNVRGGGKEQQYYTITLTNASLTSKTP